MAGRELPPKPAGLVIGQVRQEGSYGKVYSGELNGKPVVIKKLHQSLLQAPNNDKLMSDFYRECCILSTIRHANVVRFIGAYWDQEAKKPLLVMEAAKENLREFLERNKAHLDVEKQLAISSSMTEGLRFLHERAEPIIHRDLKPENVLVWEDGIVKIGDFGQSKLLDHPQEHVKTRQPGTIPYMPPEALNWKPSYTSKVDVFSLGVVMLEVCTQSSPSVLEWVGAVPEVERRKDDLALLSDTHPLKPLIIWCLQDSHESRPDVRSTHDQVKLLAGYVKEADYHQEIRQLEGAQKESRDREMGLKVVMEKGQQDLSESQEREASLQGKLEKEAGVQKPDCQQRIRQLEGALHESRDRETGLQRRLQEAVSELRHTKAQVSDLQIVVERGRQDLKLNEEKEAGLKVVMEKGQQDLQESKEREVSLQRRLDVAELELDLTKAQVEDLQRVVKKGHQDLRESEEREARLQRRLEGAELELGRTKAEVEDLQRMVKKGRQDLRESEKMEAGLKVVMEKVQADLRDMIEANAQINYLQRMVKIEQQDLRETEEWGANLQRKLEGSELELTHTRAQVESLQEIVDKGHQDLMKSKEREAGYEQRIRQLDGAQREARDRETCLKVVMEKGQQDLRESQVKRACLQEKLEEVELKLTHTKAKVANLQIVTEKVCQHLTQSKEREAGLKVVMEKGQQILSESQEREAGLQVKLEKSELELDCTKAEVEDLKRMVKKGNQDLRESEEREADLKVVMEKGQQDLRESQAELTHLRQTLDAWKAKVERQDEECLSRVKELKNWLRSRKCGVMMQLTDGYASESPRSSMLSNPSMTSTTGIAPGGSPTQQPPQQQGRSKVSVCNCKLTLDVVRAMSLYDSGRPQTVNGTKGILVTSVEMNKDTLACGVRPLDLIIQFDGKRAERLGDPFGHCNLFVKMTKPVVDVWIARMSVIPVMSDLQGLVESHQSCRKYRIVGFLVAQKDLMDPTFLLGVHMDGHTNSRKVDRVEVPSEADKAGLRKNDIIESVTLVTTNGEVHGPDAEWSFDSISRAAKSSPPVFALLMIVYTKLLTTPVCT